MNQPPGMGGQPGAPQMMNAGTPSNGALSPLDMRRKLNTYIYDYFLKNEMFDLARALHDKGDLEPMEKTSPGRKGGAAQDEDSKDDIPGKPADLPRANVPGDGSSSFLLDWWSQFWDCWSAARSKANTPTKQYLQHVQNRMIGERQRVGPGMQPNMQARSMIMQNGMMTNMDMKKAMMMQRQGPQNAQQMQQLQQMQQRQIAAQNQMQREGSQMDMNGHPRPPTPGSGENAPSPKRQRMDGGVFNGQMPPMGRGQNPGLTPQQLHAMQMQANNSAQGAAKNHYAQGIVQSMQTAVDGLGQRIMQNPNGMNQGSPAMDASAEAFNAANLRNLQQQGVQVQGNNSNGALQDYQMQLMLLEQQNKKRLLMARQEQETSTGPGVPGGPGQNGPGPDGTQGMMTNGLVGPSPNPEDQMKHGTPKLAPGSMPNPGMGQGRVSPAPGYDPNQMPPHLQFQGMKIPGAMMGPNGQLMHVGPHGMQQINQQLTPQQLEFMRQQVARQNGQWQGPPPGMMHGGMPQQAPNMTPQQRNLNMPPPPAPATGEQNRTQPSSPSQVNAAPPTPSQTNKPNPKKKESAKASNKKAAAKKGGTTAATPASEAGDQPPTPTPAPNAASQQNNKNVVAQANGPTATVPQPAPNGPAPQPDLGGSFGTGMDGGDMNFGMDFANIGGDDVLDNFDFESFLNNDADNNFAFDASMTFDTNGGLEAGADA